MDKIIEHALCDRCHSELYSDWESNKKTEEPIKFGTYTKLEVVNYGFKLPHGHSRYNSYRKIIELCPKCIKEFDDTFEKWLDNPQNIEKE